MNNRQHLPEMIRILKEAKSLLSTGADTSLGTRFVCIAVFETQGSAAAKNLLVEWITILLRHNGVYFSTYESWLRRVHGIDCHNDRIKLQASRRAWVDWMINELKERA